MRVFMPCALYEFDRGYCDPFFITDEGSELICVRSMPYAVAVVRSHEVRFYWIDRII